MNGKNKNQSEEQLKKILDKLEKRRAELNRAAEEEFAAGGNLSRVMAREEHAKFQKASEEYERFMEEAANSDEEENLTKQNYKNKQVNKNNKKSVDE